MDSYLPHPLHRPKSRPTSEETRVTSLVRAISCAIIGMDNHLEMVYFNPVKLSEIPSSNGLGYF
jgi:hypothetical protein